MKPLLCLATLLALVGLTACDPAPTPAPTNAAQLPFSGFTVSYETGSVPPPFNYRYELDGTFDETGLSLSYILTYQFRDVLTPKEITSQGYTANDDIDWTSQVTGQGLEAWRTLILQTHLGPIPPLAPGADSFTVTLAPLTGDALVGVPDNRDAWQAAVTALDKQARAATGATRTEP